MLDIVRRQLRRFVRRNNKTTPRAGRGGRGDEDDNDEMEARIRALQQKGELDTYVRGLEVLEDGETIVYYDDAGEMTVETISDAHSIATGITVESPTSEGDEPSFNSISPAAEVENRSIRTQRSFLSFAGFDTDFRRRNRAGSEGPASLRAAPSSSSCCGAISEGNTLDVGAAALAPRRSSFAVGERRRSRATLSPCDILAPEPIFAETCPISPTITENADSDITPTSPSGNSRQRLRQRPSLLSLASSIASASSSIRSYHSSSSRRDESHTSPSSATTLLRPPSPSRRRGSRSRSPHPSHSHSAPPAALGAHTMTSFDPTPVYQQTEAPQTSWSLLPPAYTIIKEVETTYVLVASIPVGTLTTDSFQVYVFDESREIGFGGTDAQMGTRVKMPGDANLARINAAVRDSTLTVTVPKLPFSVEAS
ncbi:uncharacterized protein EV422DRAFT_529853 [Fimicolochytrium jonesii]|uniref:uncharacterized protein n=1 Tax=Fimicolochytrium jonesii TaxID=1396493 RepID=UPI0022FEE446|nr:uncharacterized protein EV422DRAFT_529853 [Fimicolochytrium jonesii]KAI8820710.1 hypothetical protein EV422DRAFT_529853 [Fimicolochytrium jonesii]